MIGPIKTKQDLLRVLNSNALRYVADIEVVNEIGAKAVAEKAKALLRQQKKLHVILLERA